MHGHVAAIFYSCVAIGDSLKELHVHPRLRATETCDVSCVEAMWTGISGFGNSPAPFGAGWASVPAVSNAIDGTIRRGAGRKWPPDGVFVD